MRRDRVAAVALHEAWHAVTASLLEDDAEVLWVELAPDDDQSLAGRAKVLRPDVPTAGSLLTAIIGPLGEGIVGWPPPYDDALHETREHLGRKIADAGLTRDGYRKLVAFADEVVNDPEMKLRALLLADRLEQETFVTAREIKAVVAL